MAKTEFNIDGYNATIESSQEGRSKTVVVRDAFGFIKKTLTAKTVSDLRKQWKAKFRDADHLAEQLAEMWNSI